MTRLPSQVTRLDSALISRAYEVADRLAGEASDVLTATAGRGARPAPTESPFDWVTDIGRTLERHTRRVLSTEFPEVPVYGEEFDSGTWHEGRPGTGLRWSVDPVNGTANHVAGIPLCTYSLALLDEHGPVVGVVADPFRQQVYGAARGRGMRVNDTPVRLAEAPETRAGIVCTELTKSGPWPGMDQFISNAARAHVGVRLLGSPGLAIAQVALGHAVAAVLDSYQEWDVAGALALAAESGAVVFNRSGEPEPLPSDGLLVAAPGAAESVHEWWRSASGPQAPTSIPEPPIGSAQSTDIGGSSGN